MAGPDELEPAKAGTSTVSSMTPRTRSMRTMRATKRPSALRRRARGGLVIGPGIEVKPPAAVVAPS